MSSHLLDVEQVVEALARRGTASFSKDSLSAEVALEIREVVPDSKLLVSVPLNGGSDTLKMDILGLVNGRRLAVRLGNGAGGGTDCAQAQADLQRLCEAAPDVTGLGLAIVCGPEAPAIPEPWVGWLSCGEDGADGWKDARYAYFWILPESA